MRGPFAKGGRPRSFDRDVGLLRSLDLFWRRGYEPASVSELCTAVGINPPSLYAAFGNKAKLFLEAVNFYEQTYLKEIWVAMEAEPDVHRAIGTFFKQAARVLLSPDASLRMPGGTHSRQPVARFTRGFRGYHRFAKNRVGFLRTALHHGIKDGQLPPKTYAQSLAAALNVLLEGLSLQPRDGLSPAEMVRIAAYAVRLLPAPMVAIGWARARAIATQLVRSVPFSSPAPLRRRQSGCHWRL